VVTVAASTVTTRLALGAAARVDGRGAGDAPRTTGAPDAGVAR
jgi:hypothetical protein